MVKRKPNWWDKPLLWALLYWNGAAVSFLCFMAMLVPDAGWLKGSLLMAAVWPVAWIDLICTMLGGSF